jgi:hypothetical protein
MSRNGHRRHVVPLCGCQSKKGLNGNGHKGDKPALLLLPTALESVSFVVVPLVLKITVSLLYQLC